MNSTYQPSQEKIDNTRKHLRAATDSNLLACRNGYATMDNAAAKMIVVLANEEIARRA